MSNLRQILIEVAVMIGIGLGLAALGPFGSFGLGSFATRLAYWVPAALVGYAVVRPVLLIADAAAVRLDLHRAASLFAAAAVASAPLTLFILWWNGRRIAALPEFENWFQLYVQVALVSAIVLAIFLALELRPRSPQSSGAPTPDRLDVAPSAASIAEQPSPTFFDRLPPSWNGTLTALEMEDHYVRAHRPAESRLILMRMRDAVAELGDVEGMQVHRSWWVARAAVEGIVRDGRNNRLRLTGGLEAPIARERADALRAAGWFALRERA